MEKAAKKTMTTLTTVRRPRQQSNTVLPSPYIAALVQ